VPIPFLEVFVVQALSITAYKISETKRFARAVILSAASVGIDLMAGQPQVLSFIDRGFSLDSEILLYLGFVGVQLWTKIRKRP
jgi:hypothetical protein